MLATNPGTDQPGWVMLSERREYRVAANTAELSTALKTEIY